MYINFASDWPAYIFMAAFAVFMAYVIIKGRGKEEDFKVSDAKSDAKKGK
ncbi:MAG: hypothetical protein LBR69_00180 [Endomicrobium sp.]|jgi:hypothetical protein|nr:hypothetical protein [Endomicrobium sp.]